MASGLADAGTAGVIADHGFLGHDHLQRFQEEAQMLVSDAIARRTSTKVSNQTAYGDRR
jgi:hypothetical protein